MANLLNQLVSGIVESVVKELLTKSHGRTASKRKKRQAKAAGTSATTRKTISKIAKPARKQVSRRRTTASRSKQRSR